MVTTHVAPRRGKWINWALAASLFALVTATALIGTRAYETRRHTRIAREAINAATVGDFATATAALGRLSPTWLDGETWDQCRIAVWRVTDPAAALQVIEKRLPHTSDEFPDRRTAAEMAIRAGKLEQALQHLTRMKTMAPDAADTIYLEATLLFEKRDFAAVVAELRRLQERQPTHRGGALQLARLLVASTQYPERVRGRAELREIGEGTDVAALEARIALALSPWGDRDGEDRQALFQAVLAHPLADFSYLLSQPDVLYAFIAAGDNVPPTLLMPFARRLVRARPQEQQAVASFVFLAQELAQRDEAAEALATLKKAAPESENTMLLEARQAALEGHYDTVLASFERFPNLAASSPRALQFLVSLLEPGKPVPDAVRRRAGAMALEAPPEHFAIWLTVRARMIGLEPDRKETLVAEVRAAASGDRALPAAEWLLQAGAPEAAIEVAAPLSRAGTARATYLQFEGLLALKRFSDAAAIAATFAADSVQGAVIRARLESARSDPAAADAAWRVGFDSARQRGDASGILRLAVVARQLGLISAAYEGFHAVDHDVVEGRLAADGPSITTWLETCLRTKHTREALQVAQLLAKRTSGGDAGRYWTAYLSLLLGENLLEEKDAARTLLGKAPEDPRLRALFALAQLKTGQQEAALTTLKNDLAGQPGDALSREQRIILAAVCHANGQSDAAQRWRESVPDDSLLPEEHALFAGGA